MVLLSTLLWTLIAFTLVSARRCSNFTVSVQISARNGVFKMSPPPNNVEVTNFMLDLGQQGHNLTHALLQDYATVSGSYGLAATYCAPDSGDGKVLQILTHGIGFDRHYWDLPFDNFNYSYVEIAVDHYGYSTLAWDRLGIGASSHGEPVNEIQSFLTQAALTALTQIARSGSQSNTRVPSFAKVVHVGHSFGSILSYALARDNPSLTDGLILTGFAQNGSFLPFFEFGGNFISATDISSNYVKGYLATGNPSGFQTNFLAPGQFDPNILPFAFATSQPVTIGELLTVGSTSYGVNSFTGPVFVITGERDLPFCGGDCLATGDPKLPSIPHGLKQFFPQSSHFEASIVSAAGHGLNFEFSHESTYHQINQFLAANGLS